MDVTNCGIRIRIMLYCLVCLYCIVFHYVLDCNVY